MNILRTVMRYLMVLIIIVSFAWSVDVSTYLPKNYFKYKDDLKYNTLEYLDGVLDINDPFIYLGYTGSLIEHESCIRLTWNSCWSPTVELNTKWDNGNRREHGVGLAQLTRAWKKSGTIRLDIIRDLKRRFPKELKELTWDNVKDRPDLQIRAMVLLIKSNARLIPDHIDFFNKLAMMDSIYNGGSKYFLRERKKCGITKGCNPDIWFYNVEEMNSRGNRILYGNKTSHQINRRHVRDVTLRRFAKYYLDMKK